MFSHLIRLYDWPKFFIIQILFCLISSPRSCAGSVRAIHMIYPAHWGTFVTKTSSFMTASPLTNSLTLRIHASWKVKVRYVNYSFVVPLRVGGYVGLAADRVSVEPATCRWRVRCNTTITATRGVAAIHWWRCWTLQNLLNVNLATAAIAACSRHANDSACSCRNSSAIYCQCLLYSV